MLGKKWKYLILISIIICTVLCVFYVIQRALVNKKDTKVTKENKENNEEKKEADEGDQLEYFLREAQNYRQIGDLSNANKYFLKAVEKIDKTNKKNNEGIFSIYFELGTNFLFLRKPRLALSNFYKALEYKEGVKDKERLTLLLFFIQDIYYSLKQYNDGIKYLDQALNVFETYKIKRRRMYLLLYKRVLEYSIIYKDSIPQLRRISKYLTRLLEIEKACDNPNKAIINTLYFKKGFCYFNIGDYNKALKCYNYFLGNKKFLYYCKPEDKAVIYCFVARIYKKLGKYKKSIRFFKEALTIYQPIKSKYSKQSKYHILLEMGSVYISLRKNDLALKCYKRILEVTKEEISYILPYMYIGEIYCSLMRYKDSLESYEKSLRIIRKYKSIYQTRKDIYNQVKMLEGEANVIYFMSLLEEQKGDFKNQLLLLQKSLSVLETVKNNISLDIRGTKLYCNILLGFSRFYDQKGDFKKSVSYLLKAKEVASSIDTVLVNVLFSIIKTYYARRDMKKVEKYLDELKVVADKLKTEISIVKYYETIARLSLYIGEYDTCLEYFKKIEKINPGYPMLYNNIAEIHIGWGNYIEALKNLKKEENRLEKLSGYEIKRFLLKVRSHIADIYIKQNNYKLAAKYYKKNIETLKNWGPNYDLDRLLLCVHIKILSDEKLKYPYLLEILGKGLTKSEDLGRKQFSSIICRMISHLYLYKRDYKNALKYFFKSLSLSKEMCQVPALIYCYGSIGYIYYLQNDYNKAIENFEEAIKIIEKIRLTAKGFIRQSYFENYNYIYLFISLSYLNINKLYHSYHYLELKKAKTFAEKILNKIEPVAPPKFEDLIKEIDKNTDILMYGNTDYKDRIQFVIDSDGIKGYITKKELNKVFKAKGYSDKIYIRFKNMMEERKENIILASKEDLYNIFSQLREDNLTILVYYYRNLLEKGSTSKEKNFLKDISEELYLYLIKPIKKYIKRENLVIIPDGALGHLPFEVLICKDKNGNKKYLIEDYNISYIQSAKMYLYLSNTKPKYEKSIIAFGGIQYNEKKELEADDTEEDDGGLGDDNDSNRRSIINRRKLLEIVKQMRRGVRIKEGFFVDSINDLENIPSALKTLDVLKGYPGVQLYSGKEVTLKKLEELSRTGELAKYRIIHFGAHGEIYPSVPELSGIVLASNKDDKRPISNYLHVNRILKLKLKADLVVLAACKSGVGEITAEGLNGLTEAFMQVGARNVLVTLWSVYDEYTHIFMTKFYELLRQHPKWSYSKVLREVKLMSIRGELGEGKDREKYKSPCFWGAYVLYGRD